MKLDAEQPDSGRITRESRRFVVLHVVYSQFLLCDLTEISDVRTAHRNSNPHIIARQYAHKVCGQILSGVVAFDCEIGRARLG